MKALVAVTCMFILVAGGWFALRQWYIDTHCTTILGTQVCDSQSPAQQAPAPSPSPALGLTYSAQCAAEYGSAYAYQYTPDGHCVASSG